MLIAFFGVRIEVNLKELFVLYLWFVVWLVFRAASVSDERRFKQRICEGAASETSVVADSSCQYNEE